jgi:hypothetical protein
VRKNLVIVHNTIGTPINNKTMPTDNLTGSGIDNLSPHVLSSHGARITMIATAPYQKNAPATDQSTLLLSGLAATR